MASLKTKIYVGCSLTQATETFRSDIEKLKDILRADSYEVFDFVGLVDGTPKDVYEWDINRCVGTCDIFVGVCDYPSIGLGWELGRAVQLGKPTIAVAHADAKVTRMIQGASDAEPHLQFERYTDLLKDIPRIVQSVHASLKATQ